MLVRPELRRRKTGVSAVRGEYISHAKPQRTRRDPNPVTEESSLSEDEESNKKQFSFAFFAASREENLLSKSAPQRRMHPESPNGVFRGFHQFDFEHSPRMTDTPRRRILLRASAETDTLFATVN
jgi:hypothetical protein